MARLLIVHHTPSPAMHTLFEAVHEGATDPHITGVEVVARPALGATVPDVLEADGYLLGTPANLGYMSGALKTEASKPGSVISSPSAYFQSMRARTASAAWRSDNPSANCITVTKAN
jgi:hypothetical protein